MNIGDIYEWVTDQAIGHEARRKMHVFICTGNWQADGYVFLFINKSDFGGGLRIEKTDGFEFLTLDYSFIGLSSIVTYTEEQLRSYQGLRKLGTVPPEHLKRLYAAVRDSETMEAWQIDLVCKALHAFAC